MKLHEKRVYPGHGVVELKRFETKRVGGQETKFAVFRVIDNNMTIMMPVDKSEELMRPLVTREETDRVFDILDSDADIDQTTWNKRYREYMEKIKTGSLFEIAEVLRNLRALQRNKDLSFGERKMIDQAKSLLTDELELVLTSAADRARLEAI